MPPEGVEPEIWHGLYWDAWEALRFDRHYGAMGGYGPISYAVISQYAADHNITGADFRIFHRFMTAIDAEWLKSEAERNKVGAT